MSEFRTVISPKQKALNIDHQDSILLLGSCFTSNIGGKLDADKFDSVHNPFGTLFNPNAILKLISRAIDQVSFEKEDFFQSQDVWRHWDMNNDFSGTDLPTLVEKSNRQLTVLRQRIKEAKYIFITLGTAWVYRLHDSDQWVANCHKIPRDRFAKECLSVMQIKDLLEQSISKINKINPNASIALTVSPVRHWKDGAIHNAKSKAFLRSAIELVLNDKVDYFPSYELIMDDLRDYRFYKSDMLHPSDQAIDYIYNYFTDTYFSKHTKDLNTKIQKITLSLSHQPFNVLSEGHKTHVKNTQIELDQLLNDYPYLKNRWNPSC